MMVGVSERITATAPAPHMHHAGRTHPHTYNQRHNFVPQVNDDSEFATPWARLLVTALLSFGPPNVGVAGPICNEGKRSILTHDFTHRSHQASIASYLQRRTNARTHIRAHGHVQSQKPDKRYLAVTACRPVVRTVHLLC